MFEFWRSLSLRRGTELLTYFNKLRFNISWIHYKNLSFLNCILLFSLKMSEQSRKVPRYMAQLLDELGWNQGTRIPLANSDNKSLETVLIER